MIGYSKYAALCAAPILAFSMLAGAASAAPGDGNRDRAGGRDGGMKVEQNVNREQSNRGDGENRRGDNSERRNMDRSDANRGDRNDKRDGMRSDRRRDNADNRRDSRSGYDQRRRSSSYDRGNRKWRGGTRNVWGPGVTFYFSDGYYYGECDWLRRKAISTGSSKWRYRYNRCRDAV